MILTQPKEQLAREPRSVWMKFDARRYENVYGVRNGRLLPGSPNIINVFIPRKTGLNGGETNKKNYKFRKNSVVFRRQENENRKHLDLFGVEGIRFKICLTSSSPIFRPRAWR